VPPLHRGDPIQDLPGVPDAVVAFVHGLLVPDPDGRMPLVELARTLDALGVRSPVRGAFAEAVSVGT
jgi:hypothetical protein